MEDRKESGVISLRLVSLTDAKAFYEALEYPEVRNAVPGSDLIVTLKDGERSIEELIGRTERKEEIHMVVCNEDNQFIGMVALYEFSGDFARIGYWITKEQRDRGYGTKAVHLLIEEGHKKFGIKNFKAATDHSNEPSIRLLKRLGFLESASIAGQLEFSLAIQI